MGLHGTRPRTTFGASSRTTPRAASSATSGTFASTSSTGLTGGYGRNIMAWRATVPVTLFKGHAQMVRCLADSTGIRSNGHAWCTASDNRCVGNDIEPTRCADCHHAVVGRRHAPLYRGLYDHLREVTNRDDIGPGGQSLVQRDLQRCRRVLVALGQDPEGT